MTYLELLKNLPADRLRGIVRRRSRALATLSKCTNKTDLCTKMAKILFTQRSIGEALSETNLLQVRILVYIVTVGGAMNQEDMIADAGEAHREAIEHAVDELQNLALLFKYSNLDGTSLICPEVVGESVPAPEPYKNLMVKGLTQYPVEVISYIVKSLELDIEETVKTKQQAIGEIAHYLLDLSRLKVVMDSLSNEAAKILQFVVKSGGVASLYDIGGLLDMKYRNQLYSYDWGMRWAQGRPRNPVEEMLGKGILVLLGNVGWGYGQIIIPGDLLNLIIGRDTASWIRVTEPEATPRSTNGINPRHFEALPRDIAYLMGYLMRMEAARTNKGIMHRTALKAIAKGLSDKSANYAAFVYAIARESELIEVVGRAGRYEVTSIGLSWLEQPLAVQERSLANIWFDQSVYSEDYIDCLANFNGYYGGRTRGYRDSLIKVLVDLEASHPGDFHSLRDIRAMAAYRSWDQFLDNDQGTTDVEPYDEDEDATIPEVALHGSVVQIDEDERNIATVPKIVYRICAESLVWLGLVETAGLPAKMDTYVRLTAFGRSHFMGEESDKDAASTVDKFVVQPNLEIYAPPNLAAAHLYRLFKLADPSPSGMLTLTKENLRRALDKGESAESLIKFLKAHSATALPQNVEYLISEVGGRHGHIRVGKAGIYLQVTDPMLLKELMAQKKLGIHYREQLTDTVALVTGDSVEAILKLLRGAGYLPVSSGPNDPVEGETERRKPYVAPTPYQSKTPDVESRIDWNVIN